MRLTSCYWRMRSYWRLFILHKIALNAHWAKSLLKRARNRTHKFLQVLFRHFRIENNYHQHLTCDCSWATEALITFIIKLLLSNLTMSFIQNNNHKSYLTMRTDYVCLLQCNQCLNWMNRSLNYTKGMFLLVLILSVLYLQA